MDSSPDSRTFPTLSRGWNYTHPHLQGLAVVDATRTVGKVNVPIEEWIIGEDPWVAAGQFIKRFHGFQDKDRSQKPQCLASKHYTRCISAHRKSLKLWNESCNLHASRIMSSEKKYSWTKCASTWIYGKLLELWKLLVLFSLAFSKRRRRTAGKSIFFLVENHLWIRN